MTKEDFIKSQLEDILKEKDDEKLEILFKRINSIFNGCRVLIRKDRIAQLVNMGFEYKKIYCKNKNQKEKLRVAKSGTVTFIDNVLIIYLSTKKYDMHYLELDLNKGEIK